MFFRSLEADAEELRDPKEEKKASSVENARFSIASHSDSDSVSEPAPQVRGEEGGGEEREKERFRESTQSLRDITVS